MKDEVVIRVADWVKDRKLLQEIRYSVFVKEQSVPKELEWDDNDEKSTHLLAVLTSATRQSRPGELAIGTARMTLEGKIGRMAVLKQQRSSGVGSQLLTRLIDLAISQRLDRVYLHAQLRAVSFYAQHGFVADGAQFIEH